MQKRKKPRHKNPKRSTKPKFHEADADGYIYKSRMDRDINSKDLPSALKSTFQILFEAQLEPVFQQLLVDKNFKPLRAFADFKPSGMEFRLQVFGFCPADLYEQGAPLIPDDDIYLTGISECWETLLFETHDELVDSILNEMIRQNSNPANAAAIAAVVMVLLADVGYMFQIRWECKPRLYGLRMNFENN